MQPKIDGDRIVFNKELNALDNFVLSFIQILDGLELNYVIVSGYVAILFGRSRATEDIDLLISPISREQFSRLYHAVADKNYWILNATTEKEAFELLEEGMSIRIADNKKVIPNIELKFVKDEIDHYSLDKKIHVAIQKNVFLISPLEIQIAYKLYLGGEKDIEDAYFLYSLFKDELDIEELKKLIISLKVEKIAKKYLGG